MLKARHVIFLEKLLKQNLKETKYSLLASYASLIGMRNQSNSFMILRRLSSRKTIQSHFNSVKLFHSSSLQLKKESDNFDKIMMVFPDFEQADNKNKKTFLELVRIYEKNFPTRKGHVDFIKTALLHMKDFGVHTDIEAYKKLLDVLPKGVFVCKNKLQAEMMYYPRQQFVAIELLETLEAHGVHVDSEMGEIMVDIFGEMSYPTQRFHASMYWSCKLKNKSPWPLPRPVPSDPYELAKMAIKRITSVDLQTEITVFKTEEIAESLDKTWIVSGQSLKQKELLKKHPPNEPVIVEGGDLIYLRDKTLTYFILKADHEPYPVALKNKNDVSKMESIYFNPSYAEKEEDYERTVHEQDDGVIYATCVTGTSSQDSLLSWVRLLEKNGNPVLENLPILFRFKAGEKIPVPFSEELVTQKN